MTKPTDDDIANAITDTVGDAHRYAATELARNLRDARLRIECEVLEDVADLFELHAAACTALNEPTWADNWRDAAERVATFAQNLQARSITLAETGRETWTNNKRRLARAAAAGLLTDELVARIELHWGPPAPAHTQDAAVPPTGYHAALDTVIRETLSSGGTPVSASPDPYAPPVKIEAIKSDTPSGFPLKGFTLTETHPAAPFRVLESTTLKDDRTQRPRALSPVSGFELFAVSTRDPLLATLTRIRETLTDLVDATDGEPNPLHDILVHAANMADDAVTQRTHDLDEFATRLRPERATPEPLMSAPDPYRPVSAEFPTVYVPFRTVRYQADGKDIIQEWPPLPGRCGATTTSLYGTTWCNQAPHDRGPHRVTDGPVLLLEWSNLDDTILRIDLERAHGWRNDTPINPVAGLPAALQPGRPKTVIIEDVAENYPVPHKLCGDCATADSVGPCCADTIDNED